MRKYLLFLPTLLLLFSCKTNLELANQIDKNNSFINENLNNTYYNKNSEPYTENLAELLISFNQIKIFEKKYPNFENLITSIEFDGFNNLLIKIIDENKVIERFNLKVRSKENHLVLKGKLLLIPIPLLFYVQKQRNGVLYIDSNGNLNIIKKEYTAGWILIAASERITNHFKFTPKNPIYSVNEIDSICSTIDNQIENNAAQVEFESIDSSSQKNTFIKYKTLNLNQTIKITTTHKSILISYYLKNNDVIKITTQDTSFYFNHNQLIINEFPDSQKAEELLQLGLKQIN